MADVNGKSGDPGENALSDAGTRVLENLAELEPALVNAGIFNRQREAVALTSDSQSWAKDASELLEALEHGSRGEVFDSAHIAGAEGEVFVVSEQDLSLVAVTGRFVLASLTSYDMRMALRDISQADPRSEAENGVSSDA